MRREGQMPEHCSEDHAIIGRIVLRTQNRSAKKLSQAFIAVADKLSMQGPVTFLITPGGSLSFNWPQSLTKHINPETDTSKALAVLKGEAAKAIETFLGTLPQTTFRQLKSKVSYLTVGIDSGTGMHNNSVELVGVYDMQQGKVVHWTGKSHPVSSQQRRLIREKNLGSHMMNLNGHRVVVLGCHDLNLYSPRAASKARGWKKASIKEFISRTRSFKPDVIIQHPHETDTPHIWRLCWCTVDKKFPTVCHFASGIRYANSSGSLRASLPVVLGKTSKGSVVDFVV